MTAHYEKILVEEKARLTDALSAIAKRDESTGLWQAQSSDVQEHDADENDNADRFEDYEEKSSLVVTLEKRLTEVENALARVLEGTYGTCSVCHNQIEEERLHANPSAGTCVKHREN